MQRVLSSFVSIVQSALKMDNDIFYVPFSVINTFKELCSDFLLKLQIVMFYFHRNAFQHVAVK